jgi:hypothetical protein
MKTIKLHPEDPRLTSLVLGELPENESDLIRRSVAADPVLKRVMEELEHTTHILDASLQQRSFSLHPDQRAAILRAARDVEAAGKTTPFPASRTSLTTVLATLAAAAVITLAVLILNHTPLEKNHSTKTPAGGPRGEISLEVAMLPAPGPPVTAVPEEPRVRISPALAKAAVARSSAMEKKGDLFLQKVAECISNSPVPKDSDFPQLRPRGEVAATSQPALPLPVQAGVSSLIWITRMIREDHKHPPVNAVRIEEILNQFSLRPTGTTSVFQGATLSTETIACPWKPSAVLLLISFRGANDAARDVTANFMANPANVRCYRLLGFAPVSNLDPSPLPTRLPAKTVTSLAIEIDPSTTAEDIGSIAWSVNGTLAPPVSLVRTTDAEPSDDARFAALVCTYAQWLINQPAGRIDKEMLAALTRETFSSTLPAERLDFLNLIEQSLAL